MNLFSSSPQIQVNFTAGNMTSNWLDIFQYAMTQEASYSACNQMWQKTPSEPLQFDSLLEMFELTEEVEIIRFLQLVHLMIGKDEQIKESDMTALLEAHAKTRDGHNIELHLEDLQLRRLKGVRNELGEQEVINNLLTKVLSYDEADYDACLETLENSKNVDDSMIEQIRQFILPLKEIRLNGVDKQVGYTIAETFSTSKLTLLNSEYESHSDLSMEGTQPDELIMEDKVVSEGHIKTIHKEVIQLVTEINRLLDGFMAKETDLPRNILQILHRWTQLQAEAPVLLTEVKEKHFSEKDRMIWQQLVETYAKRQSFSKQLIYQSESTITKQDVYRWLEQAFLQYKQVTGQSQPTTTVNQTMIPMSELQQLDIHLQASNRIEKISNELVSKLSNVFQQSNFNQGRQMNQLTITLNPENLGNITVRLVEVDGDMTVRLLVTSSLTKKALETNIHQLKHMFSPHQIFIERGEGISDDEFFAEEEAFKDETLEEGNESEEKKEETSELDFEELLQEVREGEGLDDEN